MKIIFSLFSLAATLFSFSAIAATDINTPNVSGVWTSAGSPYYIHNDITLSIDQTLIIEPGVEVVFMGNYQFSVLGYISAVGTETDKIIFRANDNSQWNNFSIPEGGWKGMNIHISHFNTQVNLPVFKYCVFKDMKSLNGSGFTASYLNMEIDHCEFYNNYALGVVISVNYFGYNTLTKLKFTNNLIYNNQAATIMTSLFTDSTIMTNNEFYNNQSNRQIIRSSGLNDTLSSVIWFEDNKMYNNHVFENAAIFQSVDAGTAYIKNNKFYANSTTLKGAVSVSTKTALIEANLIANNNRVQKNGFFCGINDGGAGLHLLGRLSLHDEVGMNIFTVRNNIIANNYSDIDGAGIWANHCKVNIINNTIINNLAADYGAGLHVWGQHARVKAQNNIFYGNETEHGIGKSNFKISPVMQEVNLSYNLIDEQDTYTPPNTIGWDLNTFDNQIYLANPTMGSGLAYDAYSADFSPIESSANIIDQGNLSVQNYGITDYKGNSRIIGNGIDFGAIEFSKEMVDMEEINLEANLKFYPNPTRDYILFEAEKDLMVSSIEVYDMEGRLQKLNYTIQSGIVKINCSNLTAGQYIFNVHFENGSFAQKKITVIP